ncbi:type I-D CRISPR-associated helicase Cas3' [Candidatus Nanohalococcus occultus]|uniref:CRISPR-associated protein Cas3d n=1 Tax=Candidatus Nanohalococcus occultus TaxID=2978047 RepID=A0ABY8CDS3_9ARCH|nr:CRISPR-associated protein Cas3d [Candidatus Nanohaloarchaeota archaeon SVXNc]
MSGLHIEQKQANYLPEINPYSHQLELQEKIREDGEKILFNTSPTGSGKTFSWMKPVLEDNLSAIAVYPTNALVEDQVDAARKFHNDYFSDKEFKYDKLTRESVSEKKKEIGTDSNGKAAAHIIRELDFLENEPSILFTNPDTLILILKHLYGPQGQNLESLINGSDIVVVDEFHMAEVKQRNDLLYAVSYLMKEPASKIQKGVFLSATPDEKATKPLRNVFDSVEIVDSDTSNLEFEDSTKIMPEAELELRDAELFKTSQEIISEEKEEIQERILEICNSGRTVVMLDGLKEVDDVYSYLEEKLDLQVERIDGFHRENIGEKLENFDVLVSNSAVEVGVDFDVENLIFSAFDAPTFIQRIGRLRNPEKQTEHEILCFTEKELIETEKKDSLTREELETIVEEKLDENERPESFTRTYSVKEWLFHTLNVSEKLPDSQTPEFQKRSFQLIKNLFSTNEHKLSDKELGNEIEFINENPRLLETLRSLETYRGENFQALLYDEKEKEMKAYNLRHLLTWGKIEFLKREELRDIIPDDDKKEFDGLKDYVEGYCRYHGKREEPRKVRVRPFNGGKFIQHLRKNNTNPIQGPEILDSIAFQTDPEIESIGKLNNYTRDRKMAVKSTAGFPSKIQSIYDTSDYLMLYYTETPTDLSEMSTAFGLNAFYLARRINDNKF